MTNTWGTIILLIRWVPIVKYTGAGELGFTYDTNIVNKQW